MLRDLQALLSQLYGIEQQLDVLDYLVTDARVIAALESAETARDTEEKLLIHQDDDALGMTLYLSAELLQRLEQADPRDKLSAQNFADFCTALEGVSHFNYVAWNATADKSVTLHELELQAEVDKYVGALALLASQPTSSFDSSLYDRLFDEPQFAANLDAGERARYQSASAFAAKFCHSLRRRFGQGLSGPGMLGELRSFYRYSQPDKVSHIQSALFA